MKDSYVRLWHTAIVLLVLIFICHDSNAETGCVSDDIPCVANVGTAVMPADIAPLGKLPFKMK